jgi:hypothetical protein
MDISVAHHSATSAPSPDGAEVAESRLQRFGANAMPDTTLHPWRSALDK